MIQHDLCPSTKAKKLELSAVKKTTNTFQNVLLV